MEFQALASGSGGNCYRLTDGSAPLLLEAGISLKDIRKGLAFSVSDLVGSLVSHSHADHSKAAADLMKAGVDVYMSQTTADAIGASGHRLHPITALTQFQIGPWTILPFPLEHDVPNLGFLIAGADGTKALYASDTYYIRYRFDGLAIIAVECNYATDILDANVQSGAVPDVMRHRLLRSHFSLEHVKDFLRANDLSQVREIHLLHLSNQNSDAERFRREVMEISGKPTYIA